MEFWWISQLLWVIQLKVNGKLSNQSDDIQGYRLHVLLQTHIVCRGHSY